MSYLVIGNGYLGKKFAEYFGGVLYPDKITSQEDADKAINVRHGDPYSYVINCAGKTGRPNIDWCETFKEETFFANVTVPTYILRSCKSVGAKMIHIGSGCIYQGNGGWSPVDGCGGYTEESKPNHDASYYSWTKIVSERFLKDHDVLQLRIRMPMTDEPDPRNLITKLLQYNRVVEAFNSVTYIPDLLFATRCLIKKNRSGIYNLVNEGGIQHSEILKIYEALSGYKLSYQSISPVELDLMTRAPRSNCVLSTKKLEESGLQLPTARTAVETCIRNYVRIQKKEMVI